MPQVMIEAFARGLVDKIMVEAFEVLDNNEIQNEKHRRSMDSLNGVDVGQQIRIDQNRIEAELIENVVRGLQEVRIGDGSTVLAPALTTLEKQVKRAACSVNVSAPGEIAQGQGDVQRIIHDAIIEARAEPMEEEHVTKEEHVATETARISVSVLHRIIEQLESKARNSDTPDPEDLSESEPVSLSDQELPESGTGQRLEEELVETIEKVEYPGETVSGSLERLDSMSHGSNSVKETSETLRSASSGRNFCPEDLEEIPFRGEASERPDPKDPQESRERKKKGLKSRMRKLVRSAFGWRKN